MIHIDTDGFIIKYSEEGAITRLITLLTQSDLVMTKPALCASQ